MSDFPKHRACTTVAFLGKLNGTRHGFRLNMMTSYHMLDRHLHKHHGMLFGSYSLNMNLVVGDLLAHLAQHRNHIHSGTTCQTHY